MAEVDPYAFTNAFQRAQASQQDLRDARQMNALRATQLDQARMRNALARDPNATPEQYIRAGDVATGNALAGLPIEQRNAELSQQGAQQQIKQRALANVAPIAAHALTIQDPMQRKAYIKNAVPVFADDFKALGSNIEQGLGQIDAMPDEQLAQMLSQVAQFAPKPADEGALVAYIDPRTNQPVYGTRSQALGNRPYDKPPSIQIGSFRPLSAQEIAAAGLPAGTSAQIDTATGKIDILSKRDNTGALSQKDATTAKMKLGTVKLARQQLNAIKEAFQQGTQGVNAFGPGQALLPTQAGKLFDSRVDQMRSTLTALTRVPGVGAMSDYETKLDQSKFPKRGDYESVTSDKLQQLEDMLALIENGYTDLIGGQQPQGAQQAQQPAQPTQAPQPAPAQEITATGPNGEKIVLRNGQWVMAQ
jgi:hypothetical protein